MKHRLKLQEEKLDKLFASFQLITDEEQKAYLAKFLCIRASGFVESSFKNLIIEYLQGTTPKPIENFVVEKIKNTTNLSFKKLLLTLKMFDNNWAEDIESLVSDAQRSALNSVVSNRNRIAHGESDNISYEQMKEYYARIKEIVHILIKVIKK